MIIQIKPEVIRYERKIQGLCRFQYHNHPKGCPNFGLKDGCPPNQPLINEVLDFEKPIYLIYTEFDIGAHAERMWQKHPEWTERQAYNCLYWQPKARKSQRAEEEKAAKLYELNQIIKSPEAHGVNVTDLFKNFGIELEWPPRKITRLVSLGGRKL